MALLSDHLTAAPCPRCDAVVPARYEMSPGGVELRRECDTCGPSEDLVATDADYWLRSFSQPGRTRGFDHPLPVNEGCPFDCGLCVAHTAPPAAVIVEIIDGCNLDCPTCIAASLPGLHGQRAPEQIRRVLDSHVGDRYDPPVVMVSGGEPTTHPEFFEVLDAIVSSRKASRIFVITNGVRIAEDREFVARLAAYEQLEIYLQFDSLRPSALIDIRGADLTQQRDLALQALADAEIATTLVCVAKHAVNLDEMADVVRHAYGWPNVRGVTIQPIREVGRLDTYDRAEHVTDLGQVRTHLLQSGIFGSAALAPHPLSPQTICVGYKKRGALEAHDAADVTDTVYEKFPESADRLFALPPAVPAKDYEQLFRVAIVEYLDGRNFTTAAVRQTIIAFADERLGIVPVDTYYAYYKNTPG